MTLQHIFESVKHSLERLQLEYIDLLQCEFRFYNHMVLCALHDILKAIALIMTRLLKKL